MLGLGFKNTKGFMFRMLGLGLNVWVRMSMLYVLKTHKGLCLVRVRMRVKC